MQEKSDPLTPDEEEQLKVLGSSNPKSLKGHLQSTFNMLLYRRLPMTKDICKQNSELVIIV